MAWLDLVSHFDDDVGSRTKLCWCGCGSLLRKMKGGGDREGEEKKKWVNRKEKREKI